MPGNNNPPTNMKPRIPITGWRPKKPAVKRSIYKSLPRIVYVIELDPAVAKVPEFARENPCYISGSPCYYVGSTTLTAEMRFQNHLAGHLASPIAQAFARMLRQDLMGEQKPIARRWALKRERRRAEAFRAQGCGAYQK